MRPHLARFWAQFTVRLWRPAPGLHRPLLALFTVLTLGLVLSAGMTVKPYDYGLGEVAQETIVAPRTLFYIDTQATARLKQEVAASEPKVYKDRPEALNEALRDLRSLQSLVQQVQSDLEGSPLDKQADWLAARSKVKLSRTLCRTLVALGDNQLSEVFDTAADLVNQQMNTGITSDGNGLELARKRAKSQALQSELPEHLAQASGELAALVLRPNKLLEARQTALRQQAAAESVEPVRRRINPGDLIVRAGQVVTPEIQDKLVALNQALERPDYAKAAANFALAAALVLLMGWVLRRYLPEVYASPRLLLFLALVGLAAACLAKLIDLEGLASSQVWLGAQHLKLLEGLLLVETVMMVAILANGRTALHMAWALSVVLALAYEAPFSLGAVLLLTAVLAALAATSMSRRLELLAKSWLYIGLANVGALLLFEQLSKGLITPAFVGFAVLGGESGGLLAAMLTVGGTLLLEGPLDALTPFRLTELASSDHPLLRELALKAPGSYQSCLRVSTLAEAAAEAIGANVMLAKVGALFHDVGKLERPYCFVENQGTEENPHDRLSPELSKRIIISHVAHGVELARKHKLPKAVIEIIAESHGTSLVRFFYAKALKEQGPDKVSEADYRYPGPRPHSKESAIVMISDNVESRVTAAGNPTPAEVDEIIHNTVKELMEDGQLEECDLTLADLTVIQRALKRVLQGILHHRIEYPELASIKANGNNGDTTSGSA